MNKIMCTTTELRDKAQHIKNIKIGYDEYVETLRSQARELDKAWKGESANAFQETLQNKCIYLDRLSQILQDYSDCLIDVADQYDETENDIMKQVLEV